jgi:transcriptional regulator with XRE-family HTH domain
MPPERRESPAERPPIGRVIAVLRESRHLNQAGLARAAHMAPSVISEYESSKRRPRLRNLQRILGALDYDLTAIEETERYLTALARHEALRLAGERELAPALWAGLARKPASARRKIIAESREYHSWGLCELLCLESTGTAPKDPAKALYLAELAVHVADQIDRAAWLPRLQTFAWAHVGNSRRVAGDLHAADEAFATSDRFARIEAIGPRPPLEEARVPAMKASLRVVQGRFSEARALLDRALALDTGSLRGTLLVAKAKAVEELGDLAGAIELLREAEPRVLEEDDPRLTHCLRQNLVWLLATAGYPEEAQALLPEVVALARKLDNDVDFVRLRWAEARIAEGFGDLARAVAILLEVRGELARCNINYDQALVSLEIAGLYLEQDKTAEVKAIARHLVPIFQANDVPREALAALAVFRRAAEMEQVTLDLVQKIRRFLQDLRQDPSLTFKE